MPIMNKNNIQIGEIALIYKILKIPCDKAKHHHHDPDLEMSKMITDKNQHVVVNSSGVLDIMVVG